MPTFGFEAEYEVNTPEMVTYLRNADRMMIGPPNIDHILHRYHCDCETCIVVPREPFDEYGHNQYIFPLRAQRDSTCAGELISKVFDDIDEAIPIFRAMETAALEADAEPGENAGLHVHVGLAGASNVHLRNAFYEWLRWEPVITTLALGRFAWMRDMNRMVRQEMNYHLDVYVNAARNEGSRIRTHREVLELHRNNTSIKNDLLMLHQGNDRHTSLSVRTRYNTWEFRIWNSTRSAWRMELACRFSMGFMEGPFLGALMSYDSAPELNHETAVRHLITTFRAMRPYRPLAELIERQFEYGRTTALDVPMEFTAIAFANE